MITAGNRPSIRCPLPEIDLGGGSTPTKLGFFKIPASNCCYKSARSSFSATVKAMEGSKVSCVDGKADFVRELDKADSNADDKGLVEDSKGKSMRQMSTIGNSSNIVWHKCSVKKIDRQELLQQKGCVIWITGLSGSGKGEQIECTDSLDNSSSISDVPELHVLVQKVNSAAACVEQIGDIVGMDDIELLGVGFKERALSILKSILLLCSFPGIITLGKSTLACALSQGLHSRGKLTYILDGDNVRHGLNRDLSFKAVDRAENIRRIGEVAKLFADAGVICIASLISPYRKDRDACRALLSKGEFIEVFMDMPLRVCEARDPKGLYKLARAGKIEGFTGIDDPYEPPLNSEIVLQQKGGVCASPCDMAETVISYLEENGYLIS
ncbi:hypothetical protein RHGRI_023314 [Rhododendron griersonianum]|uniref:Adenylyl-sulfate kinase n=1 Tax=Rhododendron griersonianum TaxID=479676 RepID=A0AAV6J2V7_9ERIC|nr:hypothetical protein RHGRI_023314 [Rhododendron griersonianum]